jgi:hypothetical protein
VSRGQVSGVNFTCDTSVRIDESRSTRANLLRRGNAGMRHPTNQSPTPET